jgi:hypothetical protein
VANPALNHKSGSHNQVLAISVLHFIGHKFRCKHLPQIRAIKVMEAQLGDFSTEKEDFPLIPSWINGHQDSLIVKMV